MVSLASSEGDLGLRGHVVSKQQGGLEGGGQVAVQTAGRPQCNYMPGADPKGNSGKSSTAKIYVGSGVEIVYKLNEQFAQLQSEKFCSCQAASWVDCGSRAGPKVGV